MVLDLLPDFVTSYTTVITLLFTGIAVENYYVGRITVFQNSVALLVHAERFESVGLFLTLYLFVGLGAGLYGLWHYLSGSSLSDIYYDSVFYLYSSATVGTVILLTDIFNPTLIWLVIGIAVSGLVNTWIYYRAPEDCAPVSPENLSLAYEFAGDLFGKMRY
jgi:hypothetical protein